MVFSANTHALVVAAVAIVMIGVWLAGRTPDQEANAAIAPPAERTPAQLSPPPPALPRPMTIHAPVKRGDNLSMIFQRHELLAADLHRALDSGALGRRLKDIHPGHAFEFTVDDERNLLRMRYRPARFETVTFERVGDSFESRKDVVKPDTEVRYVRQAIDSSLFGACNKAGLGDGFAIRLAGIFQWDIDFILDIRSGDEFHVLYNEYRKDGKFAGIGEILAAEIVNQGESYRAVLYRDDNAGESYYTPDGRNMRKAFLRAPLDYSRISSNFNMRRFHPIRKDMRPHRGIDYAAPPGTDVRAASDGKVVAAGFTHNNGNYVVIRHGQRYHTKYLHLRRIASGIKPGTRIKQGQTIGEVGSTGLATGPHLHYEFLVDGVHQNPRTVDLPAGEPIREAERLKFNQSAAVMLADLDSRKSAAQVAYSQPGT